ncbi:MAG: hypothetical protein U0894_08060 [Pirellulales bacterium]
MSTAKPVEMDALRVVYDLTFAADTLKHRIANRLCIKRWGV